MLRRIKSHGSFPICESAYTFTLEDRSATRGCPISSPLFHVELSHSSLVASVHVSVHMFVQVKLFTSYSSEPVHPSCKFTHTLSVRQRSAENTEKKKKKKNKSVAEKRQISELAQERKWTEVFSLVLFAFSLKNWSMSVLSCPGHPWPDWDASSLDK